METPPIKNEIDVDTLLWESIKNAARKSKWIPKEYFMNDWVADVREYLINGFPKGGKDDVT